MNSESINFFLKSEITIEEGILRNLENEIYKLGLNNPLFLFDNNLENSSYFQEIYMKNKAFINKENFISVNISGEPTYDFLNELNRQIKDINYDCIISFGGGSTMDIGKGLCILATNPKNPIELKGFPENLNIPLPHITVPTVLGSGAEASFNAVFIDTDEERKLGINSRNNFPIRVLVDPLITMSAPKRVVIASALDSLVHCIDSYGSRKSTTISKSFSKIGFKNSWKFLTNKNFDDPAERKLIAIGSIFGIYGLMNSGDGPTNGFAYYFGVKDKIPHGMAGGMFLRDVMKWNCNNGYDGYNEIFNDINISSKEVFFKMFDELYANLGIKKLKEYNYKATDLNDLSKKVALSLTGSFAGNPILFDENSAFDVLNYQFMEE
tara:strand:+ start:1428 stop:2570 length:1143 start_codon:yes stop_codon:yes gene_type:complete